MHNAFYFMYCFFGKLVVDLFTWEVGCLFIYLFMLQWLNGVPCVCAGVCDECATF